MTTPLIFESLHSDVQLPQRSTAHAAGYDVRAYLKGRTVTFYNAIGEKHEQRVQEHSFVLMPKDRALVPLGFKARLEPGVCALVLPRSGASLKIGLVVANSPGLVDADYPGEWGVIATNISDIPVVIDHGERIAQLLPVRYESFEFLQGTVEQTTERAGGYGSTGR